VLFHFLCIAKPFFSAVALLGFTFFLFTLAGAFIACRMPASDGERCVCVCVLAGREAVATEAWLRARDASTAQRITIMARCSHNPRGMIVLT